MSLSEIYAAHLNSKKDHKDRDPKRMFLSDLGKCPRQVGYRLLQTPRDYRSDQSDVNSTIMFDLAEHIEAVLAEAMGDDVIAYQEDAPITDITPQYTNWGGRCDIIAVYFGRRVLEVKSLYPSSFKPDLPEKHPYYHLQAKSYDIYFRERYDLNENPLLAYFDRGGTNTPIEVEVTIPDSAVFEEMDRMEAMRDALPDLPPKLGKVLEVRTWGKKLMLEPDSSCRQPYCKYTEVCKPDTGTSCMAEREDANSPWKLKKASRGHEQMVEEYTTKLAKKVMEVT